MKKVSAKLVDKWLFVCNEMLKFEFLSKFFIFVLSSSLT